ncbi:MAG: hypothetical protein FJ161_04830, partial [Gammaproteobacteria bacterium]|nr:hypothetical protein [Gammaproteobacteria bacterium]
MKKTSILSLSLTAMTFCVSTGLQALTSNYEICFDGRATTTQKNSTNSNVPSSIMLPNNIFISHARCELSGEISDIIVSDLTKNWSYHIELETPGFENSQFNLNPSGWNTALQENGAIPNLSYAMFDPALVSSVFSLAYFSWDCCENVSFMLGKIPCPEITSDRIYYRPYIAEFPTNLASGAIIGYSGNHDGFAMKGQIGAIHYQFGAWRQTLHRGIETFPLTANAITGSANFSAFYTAFIDSSSNISSSANFEAPSSTVNFAGNFDEKNLRIGYSGRLHYSRELFDGLMIGAGLGYLHAPLNAPISIITMGQTYSTSPSQNLGYSVAAFNNLESFACDIQGAYGKAQFN